MLERGGRRYANAEVFRRHRDRHGELQRVVDGDLRRLLNGVVIAAFVDVVIADDVGDKNSVENSSFECRCELRPVLDVLVLPGAVAGMGPQARRLMGDAVHVERVEADLSGHGVSPDFRGIQAAAPAPETRSRSRIWAWRNSSRSKLQTSCRRRENSGVARRSSSRERDSRGMSITCLMRPGRDVMTATRCPR